MDTNPSPLNSVADAPPAQTGAPQQPIQVENVQYNVHVGKFFSRIALAFRVANLSLIIVAFVISLVLFSIAGELLRFAPGEVAKNFIFLVAVAVPLVPLFWFSNKRLHDLMKTPANIEDVTFKKSLRRTLWVEIIIGALLISSGIYSGLSDVFITKTGNGAKDFSSVIIFGGLFVFLGLWTYSFQRKTQR